MKVCHQEYVLQIAFITLLPNGYMDIGLQYLYHDLEPADKDFVYYWWRVLFRRPRPSEARETSGGAMMDSAKTNDVDGFSLAEEELQLMRDLERADKRTAHEVASQEFATLQDRQASDVLEDKHKKSELEKNARRY